MKSRVGLIIQQTSAQNYIMAFTLNIKIFSLKNKIKLLRVNYLELSHYSVIRFLDPIGKNLPLFAGVV